MKRISFLLAVLPIIAFSQHKVEGVFTPAENFSFAMLYKSTPTGAEYVSRGVVESDGSFEVDMDANAPSGIYKVVYGLPQDDNNFDFIYNAKEDVKLTFSLEEGLVFKESNENTLWASYTNSMELVNMAISNFYEQENESTDKTGFADIFKTLKQTQEAFEAASKGTIASIFINANTPYIPAEYEDILTYSKNLKRTYLQHIDFNNKLLQSSNFLSDRLMAYVFAMSASTENTVYEEHIDDVAKAIETIDIEVKSSLIEMFWNRFVELDNSEMANYITNSYLLDIVKQTNNTELLKTIITYRDNAIGEMAIDFAIQLSENGKTRQTSLQKLDIADNYLVIFWSSTCFHCLDELPKLKAFLEEHPKNLKVIAFGIEDDDVNWKRTITQFPDFIHVLGLGKWENTTVNDYGVESTPSYFLIDSNKIIIGKPKKLEELKEAIGKLK